MPTKITLNVDSFLRFIESILVLLSNPFYNSHSPNLFQLESACSSSCMLHLYVGKRA